MEIRYLSERDSLYEVSSVYERSWKHAYKGIIPQAWLDAIPAGRWADGCLRDKMNNLVAIEDGRIIGVAGFCAARWKGYSEYGELVSLYLLPEYTGRGYGRDMLRYAVKELYSLGFRRVMLWALEENVRAGKFYEKYGFMPTEEYMADSFAGREVRERLYILEDVRTFLRDVEA